MKYIPFEEVRRGRVKPGDLRRRIREWMLNLFIEEDAQIPDGYEDLEHAAGDSYSLTTHNDQGVAVGDSLLEITLDFLYLSDKSRRHLLKRQTVDKFEREVLRVTGFRVIDYEIRTKVPLIRINVADIRTRTSHIEKPKYLYHVAPENIANKILQRGLIPHKGPKDRPMLLYKNRIYLFTKPRNWYDIAREGLVGNVRGDTNFVVLRVDTNRFDKFNIFADPEASNDYASGVLVWTPTHIPAYAIEEYLKIDVSIFEDPEARTRHR